MCGRRCQAADPSLPFQQSESGEVSEIQSRVGDSSRWLPIVFDNRAWQHPTSSSNPILRSEAPLRRYRPYVASSTLPYFLSSFCTCQDAKQPDSRQRWNVQECDDVVFDHTSFPLATAAAVGGLDGFSFCSSFALSELPCSLSFSSS